MTTPPRDATVWRGCCETQINAYHRVDCTTFTMDGRRKIVDPEHDEAVAAMGRDTTEAEALARAIVEERLRQFGYDDEWIRAHENPPDHRVFGCELVPMVGWQCDDDEMVSRHPDHDTYATEADNVMFVLKSAALAADRAAQRAEAGPVGLLGSEWDAEALHAQINAHLEGGHECPWCGDLCPVTDEGESCCNDCWMIHRQREAAERALVERLEAALAFTDPENGVSCDGPTVDRLGCYAGTLAARIRAALAAVRPNEETAARCGSCGEPSIHNITLDGEPMPVCLRHLNHWQTPTDETLPAILRREASRRTDRHYVHVATVRTLMRKLADHMDAMAKFGSGPADAVRRDDIAAKIEASSLGTPEAQALRATVSDERAAQVVARAAELSAAAVRPDTEGEPTMPRSECRCPDDCDCDGRFACEVQPVGTEGTWVCELVVGHDGWHKDGGHRWESSRAARGEGEPT